MIFNQPGMLGLTALAKAAGEILVCYKEPLWIQGHLAENPAQGPGADLKQGTLPYSSPSAEEAVPRSLLLPL